MIRKEKRSEKTTETEPMQRGGKENEDEDELIKWKVKWKKAIALNDWKRGQGKGEKRERLNCQD